MSLGVPPSVCPSVRLSPISQEQSGESLLKFGSKVDAEEFGGDVCTVTSQDFTETRKKCRGHI